MSGKTRRLLMTMMGGKKSLPAIWGPGLNPSSARVSMAVIGDSIVDGYSSTNFDATDFVSLVRATLQTKYGNGGEGFISTVHAEPTGESGWENPPANRWSFGVGGRWTLPSFDTKEGWGAIAAAPYWNGATVDPQITATFDSVQVMTGIKFDTDAQTLEVIIDGGAPSTISLGGGAAGHSQFAPGTLYTYTAALGSHTVLFNAAAGYVWIEGVRPLIGSAGIVVDRFGKAGMRAQWLGVPNDADYTNYNVHYKALAGCVDVLPTNLFVVMLGVNDFVNSVTAANFQTYMGVIAARCKAKGNCILVVPPKPNSGTDAAYLDYANAIIAAGAANSCTVLNIFSRWGSTYNAAYMENDTHPNNAGHADIAQALLALVL
jgi:lysophospholipase L1-like esterase